MNQKQKTKLLTPNKGIRNDFGNYALLFIIQEWFLLENLSHYTSDYFLINAISS